MPYRRLPNTDAARISSLKKALSKSQMPFSENPVIPFKLVHEIETLLPKFETAVDRFKSTYNEQAKANKKHQVHLKNARLYVSHFIQVLNMAVIRQEVKREHKSLYGLAADENTVPDLASESAVLEWGKKVIDGERARTSKGGVPIYTPSIAKVSVLYDVFKDSYQEQQYHKLNTQRAQAPIASLREQIDALILELWNIVEERFRDLPNDVRLDTCRSYGVIYYYHSNEKEAESTDD